MFVWLVMSPGDNFQIVSKFSTWFLSSKFNGHQNVYLIFSISI